MQTYVSGQLIEIRGERKKLSVIEALKNPKAVEKVSILLDTGESVQVCPSKIEADLFDRALFVFDEENETVIKVKGKVKTMFLRPKNAHLEIRLNPESYGFGSYNPADCTVKVFLKKDFWKAFQAFSDPDARVVLVNEGFDLGPIRSLKQRIGKFECELEDGRKFVGTLV